MKQPAVACTVFLLSWALRCVIATDPDCHGHGVAVDGKCVCSTPVPQTGSVGYVGDFCDTAVYRYSADASDISASCPGATCNKLQPGQSVCFLAGIESLFSTSFHFSLLLRKLEGDDTLQLWGLLTDVAASQVLYPNSTAGFSFVSETTGDSASTTWSIDRATATGANHNGLYMCVARGAPGDASFSLRAALHSCPFNLADDGKLKLCSSNSSDVRWLHDTCPDGTCHCRPPYTRPVPAPKGLGFDDCSAAVFPLELSHHGSIGLPHVRLGPGAWQFYSFDLADSDYSSWFVAQAVHATSSVLELYLAHLRPPSRHPGEHDVATGAWQWSGDLTSVVAISHDDAFFKTGTWWLGVYANGHEDVTYALTAYKHPCLKGCSGRGTCDDVTHKCTCKESYMEGADCASSTFTLTLNNTLTVLPRVFAIDHLQLPLTPGGLPTSSLVISASFNTSTPLPAWVTARPYLSVSQVEPAPGVSAPSQQLPLPAPNTTFTLELSMAELSSLNGSLHLSLHNPLDSYPLGYEVTVARVGRCLNDCSGHGECGEDGACVCTAPWAGGDCSVTASGGPPGSSCTPGSLHGDHDDSAHGTCYHACDTNTSTWDNSTCAAWACDALSPEGKPQRQKGTSFSCVVDTCAPGPHTYKDETGNYVCTKQCVCPEDGSACALAPDCNPGSMTCLGNRVIVTDGTGSKCVDASSECADGSLSPQQSVPGGHAFRPCSCSSPADPLTCSFLPSDPAAPLADAVIVCQPGFELKGSGPSHAAKHLDGSAVMTGGHCIHIRHGTSGGMVFFWCMFTLFMAVGVGAATRYAKENGLVEQLQQRYQQWRAARQQGFDEYSGTRLLP